MLDDTSRLSRSTESVLSIYRKLNFAGLQLISDSQGIDSRQDQAETLLTIHGLIDSSYVRELAKKTHRGCESAVLRSQLNRDTALAKAELQKHLSEVRMTPRQF